MALIDRGDTYRVGFLGSAMMAQVGTGLGVLQKPLRQLYFSGRQPSGETRAQERYLLMSRQGLTITYRDSPTSAPQEVFYDMPSILFWDAVQFVTVRADKKIKGAFEPLDDNHSRSKDNIFSHIEKKYHYLAQISHPPLFTCVLRRTSGVKALDVHAFVCATVEEALSLLRTLNVVQRLYKSGEVHGTGVFEYNPFSEPLSPVVPGTGPASVAVFPPPASPESPGDISRNVVQSADHSRRQQHHPAHVQPQMAPNVTRAAGAGAHQMYQLKQEDFIVTGQEHRSDCNVFDIDNSGDKNEIHHQGQNVARCGPARGLHEEGVYSSIIERNNHLKSPRVQPQESFSRKIEYQSITRHLDLFEDTLHPGVPRNYSNYQHNNNPAQPLSSAHSDSTQSRTSSTGSGEGSPTVKLGQGYSLLTGSQSPIPGQNTPRYADEEAECRSEWARDRGRYHGPSSHEAYSSSPRSRFTSSSGSSPPPSPAGSANHPQDPYDLHGHYDVPKRKYFMDYDGNLQVFDRNNQTPARDAGKVSVSELKQKLQDRVHLSKQNSFNDPEVDKLSDRKDLYDIPKQPPRPVAKVHPHKIQGVRVLPLADPSELQFPLKTSEPSINSRPKSGLYDQGPLNGQQVHSPDKKTYNEKSQNSDNVKTPQSNYQSNWQFKPTASKDMAYHTSDDGKSSDSPMNDKLLLSQKKDAEIAAVLQNLTFDPAPRLNSAGPAGTDFERSLGYLP